jgi:hypothetical protein
MSAIPQRSHEGGATVLAVSPDPDLEPARAPSRERLPPVGVTAPAVVLAVLVPALLAVRAQPDIDLWLHLRIADLLVARTSFALPDPLTALADRAYRPSQWGGELLWWSAERAGGITGAQVLRGALVVGLVGLIAAACTERGSHRAAGWIAVGATFATSAGWGERPQLIGLVLLALSVLLWWRSVDDDRVRWVHVPLGWVWACVHGSWALGVLAGGLAVLVMAIDERRPPRRLIRHAAVVLGSLTAAALTPLGPDLLLDPFRVAGASRGRVDEWLPPTPANILFLVVLALATLALVASARRRPWRLGRLFVVLAAAAMALSAVRLGAVAAVLLAPIATEALGRHRTTTPSDRPTPTSHRSIPGQFRGALAVAAAGALLVALIIRPAAPLPDAVASAVRTLPAGTVLLVDPAVSGWVLWDAPQVRPVRDLRAEVYSAAVADRIEHVLDAGAGWERSVTAWGTDAVLVPFGSPLGRALAGRPEWTTSAATPQWLLYRIAGADRS